MLLLLIWMLRLILLLFTVIILLHEILLLSEIFILNLLLLLLLVLLLVSERTWKNKIGSVAVVLEGVHVFFFIFEGSLEIIVSELFRLVRIVLLGALWTLFGSVFWTWLPRRQLHFRSLILSLTLTSICSLWNLSSQP